MHVQVVLEGWVDLRAGVGALDEEKGLCEE
jgi:hypothetical protein